MTTTDSPINTQVMETYYGERLVDAINDGEIADFVVCEYQEDCSRCRATGEHSHRFGEYSSEEFSDLDDDFRNSYLSGKYDAQCEECKGSGFIYLIDQDKLPTDAYDYLMRLYKEERDNSEY